jgi:hypothetical protein
MATGPASQGHYSHCGVSGRQFDRYVETALNASVRRPSEWPALRREPVSRGLSERLAASAIMGRPRAAGTRQTLQP